jgi:hypothetical protein
MARFGGNEFTGFSIPLVFEGRYFIMEPGNPPLLTVIYEKDGEPLFEVLKNEPRRNPISETSKSIPGIVTVSAKSDGRFLYKIRPGSETSVAFGKIGGGEITARITDRIIQVGGFTIQNNTFIGDMAGVIVFADGGVGIGAKIPPKIREWLSSK